MKLAESVLDIFQLNHLRSGSDPGSRGRTMPSVPAVRTYRGATFWATDSSLWFQRVGSVSGPQRDKLLEISRTQLGRKGEDQLADLR